MRTVSTLCTVVLIGAMLPAGATGEEAAGSYYFSDGQRIALTPSPRHLAVRFAQGIQPDLGAIAPSIAAGRQRDLPVNRLTLFDLRDETSAKERAALISTLVKRPEIELVAQVFRTPDALMIVADQFIAAFVPETTRQAIEQLADSDGVEVVRQLTGEDNVWLLRVRGTDALEAANRYHRLPAVLYAHPDFVRVGERKPLFSPDPDETVILGPDGERLPPETPIAKGTSTLRGVEPMGLVRPRRTTESSSPGARAPVSRTTIKSEGFEGTFPNSWTLYGSPTWDDEIYRKYAGSWSGYCVGSSIAPPGPYPNDANAWMVYGPFSLADALDARVDLQAWIETESGYDYFGIYASVDNSGYWGWNLWGDWAGGSGGSGWMNIGFDLKRVYTLGDLRGESQVWIALVFFSDELITYEGVYVDSVVIEKITGGYESLTSDTYDHLQWSLENNRQLWGTEDADIDAAAAWGISHGSDTVTVAIIDEGVDLSHPDLAPKMVTGYDATTGPGGGGAPSGDDAHGTNCAGIAAAVTANGAGVAGIAREARIMPVRIAYGDGFGGWITSDAWLADGINWAWMNGADVLSNSWGGGSPATVITNAIAGAKTSGRGGLGSVVVFSSGNDNGPVSYPATLSTVLAVGALSPCDQRKAPSSCDGEYWWGSNFGSQLDLSAPGVHMYTTDISGVDGYDDGDYFYDFNGTSSAAPVVAGVAALVLGYDPTLTAAQVEDRLEATADDLGAAGRDDQFGHGRVNALAALQAGPPPTCYLLTRSHTGAGADPVATPPNSTGCTASRFYAGETIGLTAAPDPNWAVSGWTGTDDDASTSNSNSLTMPAGAHTVSVAYALPTYLLSVSLVGTGTGTVTSSPPGIACGGDCDETCLEGTKFLLSGTPSIGSELTSWTGHADCSDGLVTMVGDRSCTATFNTCSSQSQFTLENTEVISHQVVSACNYVNVGPDVQVTGTGVLDIYAGNGVALYDGFETEGGGEMKAVLGQPMP